MYSSTFNIMRKYAALPVLLMVLASCEKEITVKVPEYKPLLVINSSTLVGDTISLSVGKSVGILKYKNNLDLDINNANVSLYKSGSFVEEMKYDHVTGQYVSNTIADDGQSYSITVNAPGYGEAQAATKVPSYVPITNVQHIPNARLSVDGNQQDELRITFKDPPGVGDYYIISLLRENDPNSNPNNYNYYGECVNTIDASVENINNENIDQNTCLNSNAIFLRDGVFNGTTKELRLFVNSGFLQYYPPDSSLNKVEVVLQHVTEDYFKFKKTYQFASENNENPFAEPTNVYTNVKNGYGVFSVMSYDAVEIK